MIKQIGKMSKQKAVTTLRILYPIWFVVGLFGVMYVPTTLVVAGDAAATATNIVANEMLFRAGIVGSLITQLIHIAVVVVLYKLFSSVNRNKAGLLVVLGLIGVPISMLNTLNRVAALLLLNGSDYLKVFEQVQLNALVMFFLNLNEQGMFIATIFWGLWLFPLAYLIYKSGYFPKMLGVLMLLAGLAYFIEPFILYLLPSYAEKFVPVVYLLTMGEVIFMGWVMFKGAKLPKAKS